MGLQIKLIEELLYEAEGTSLDFKQQQYKFQSATDNEKSELLKDILAFSNSWRRSDAFILIGVVEEKGAKSQVIGISDHLDDANLQQFVNSKTQRPVIFSYNTISIEGKPIGVIHIPVQQRPLYLKKDYGKLKKNIVYVRHGSSTAEADPDEVAQMGIPPDQGNLSAPILDLQFANTDTGELLGDTLPISVVNIAIPNSSTIPDYPSRKSSFYLIPGILDRDRDNPDYYREMATYLQEINRVSPTNFAIINSGLTTAQDVKVEITIQNPRTIFLMTEHDLPSEPIRSGINFVPPYLGITSDTYIKHYPDAWLARTDFDKVQPQRTVYTNTKLYIGAACTTTIELNALIYADNLPQPTMKRLEVIISSQEKILSLDDLTNSDD